MAHPIMLTSDNSDPREAGYKLAAYFLSIGYTPSDAQRLIDAFTAYVLAWDALMTRCSRMPREDAFNDGKIKKGEYEVDFWFDLSGVINERTESGDDTELDEETIDFFLRHDIAYHYNKKNGASIDMDDIVHCREVGRNPFGSTFRFQLSKAPIEGCCPHQLGSTTFPVGLA